MGEAGAAAPLLAPSAHIEDSYIVGVLIGRGTFSQVYKCLHKGKTERACKVYKKAHLATALLPQHISNLLKLNHNYLVSVHDVFETDKELRVVVDLAAGEELLERIERSEHYSEREAARAVHCILQALKYLHSHGVVHGGVFPENLLFESEVPNARLRLSEVAMPKTSQSPTSLAIYSAPNMTPDQTSVTHRCAADIWSLGILIYIMLCGSEPSAAELAAMMDGCAPEEWSDVSASARSLISQMLQEAPGARLTAEGALRHPWVCGTAAATRHMLGAQERLKTFNARRKLRATTHVIIATQRAMSIIRPLRSCQVTR